ncbi:MAG: hypothetical protein GXO64_03500 [Candidatus Micrarchaeota archaeon]|nr:hypothetical protein [Candidatus Micrarchaeota archaeon]
MAEGLKEYRTETDLPPHAVWDPLLASQEDVDVSARGILTAKMHKKEIIPVPVMTVIKVRNRESLKYTNDQELRRKNWKEVAKRHYRHLKTHQRLYLSVLTYLRIKASAITPLREIYRHVNGHYTFRT